MIPMLLKYRVPILLVLIGSTILIGLHIKDLARDAGVSSLLPQDHPEYVFWREAEEIFGAADQVVIGITATETVYTPETIRLIDELTVFLENLEDVDEDDVTSLTSVEDMEGRDGELLIESLIDVEEIKTLDNETLQMVQGKVRSNPLFWGKLVSRDERSTVIVAGTPGKVAINEEKGRALKNKIVNKLTEARRAYPETTIYLSGVPILNAYTAEYMQRDIIRLFPLAMLVVMVLLALLLRSVYGMIVPVLVTLFSIVWTFGLKGFIGSPLTLVESVIPVMLIAIGCADGVHIISEFFHFLKQGNPVPQALTKTMQILTMPVILTSVTTGIGFASLITAPGISIRNMGMFLAFGVMVALVYSLFFIPTLTSFYRTGNLRGFLKPRRFVHRDFQFHEFMQYLGVSILKHKYIVLTITLGFLLASVLGILQINVEADEIKYFKPKNHLRIAAEQIQERLGGVVNLDIIIEANEQDAMKEPKLLHAIEDLQRFCESRGLISYTLSLADYVKRINYVLHDSDPAYQRLPNEIETVAYEEYEDVNGQEVLVQKTAEVRGIEQVAQFLLLYDMGGGDVLDSFVDDQYKKARIVARLGDGSTQKLERVVNELRTYIQEHFAGLDVNVRFANYYIHFIISSLIVRSQLYSILTVFVAILILMAVLFRSLLVGILTSFPVFIAILFNFAVMWVFNVTLNIGTSIVAAIGMGVGIDYAIHYFARFKLILRETQDYDSAIVQAITETSRPILSNAAAVGMGFLVLIFSEYEPIMNVGWVTALSMATTALSSLIVLPALLSIFKPKAAKVKNLLAVAGNAVIQQK